MTSVSIGSGVASIGEQAFYQCYSLSAITVDELNTSYSSTNGVLFNKDRTVLIQCPGTKLGSYTVPLSVTAIEGLAFYNCTNLVSVTIPDSVVTIADHAFSKCASLTNLSIGSNVTNIGNYAFSECTRLTDVTLPHSVISIGWEAFFRCSDLRKVTIGHSVTSIGSAVFEGCTNLLGIYFKGNAPTQSPTYLDAWSATVYHLHRRTGWGATFGYRPTALWVPQMQALREQDDQFGFDIAWAEGLTTIIEASTNLAFPDWVQLDTITLSADLVPFRDSRQMAGPARFYRIFWLPFTYITNNGGITITKYIGPVGDVTIPDTITGLPVTAIGPDAFVNETNMARVTIPNSVTTIGGRAFQSCTNLSNITIPRNVTTIGMDAFRNCISLTNIAMPASITDIGDSAFYNCSRLTGVYFKGNAPRHGSSVFVGANTAIIYFLPGTTGWGPAFAGRPTLLWNPQVLTTDDTFGVNTNGFGFTIAGTTNIPIVVESCTNLDEANWIPLRFYTLTNGSVYFSDSDWTSHTARFYHIRRP